MVFDENEDVFLKIESDKPNWGFCTCFDRDTKFVLKSNEDEIVGEIVNIPAMKHRRLEYSRDDNLSLSFPIEFSCEKKATLIGALFLISFQHVQ